MRYKKYYEILKDEKCVGSFHDEDYIFFKKHNLDLYFHEKMPTDRQVDDIEDKKILLILRLSYKKSVSELCSIGKKLDEKEINYLSIKGISISETYPEPFTRTMGDHDILVRPKDFERARNALLELGYSDEMNISTFKDISLLKKGSKMIELHHTLFNSENEPYAEHFTEEIWKNPVKIALTCGTVSVPSPEIHFKYITLHMMKHLKGNGFGLKFLLDFKYFAMFHRIDFEKQLEFFKVIGYSEFYRAIVTLCHYEIGLPVKSESWLYEREAIIIQQLADFIAEGGAFGKDSEKHRIVEHYEKYNNLVEGNRKVKIFIIALFPPKDLISDRYTYLNDHQWLLPVAWVHRLFRMGLNKNIRFKEKLFFFTLDEVFFSEKDYMMKTLGLREDE